MVGFLPPRACIKEANFAFDSLAFLSRLEMISAVDCDRWKSIGFQTWVIICSAVRESGHPDLSILKSHRRISIP